MKVKQTAAAGAELFASKNYAKLPGAEAFRGDMAAGGTGETDAPTKSGGNRARRANRPEGEARADANAGRKCANGRNK